MVEACLWIGLLIGPSLGGVLVERFDAQTAYLLISIPFGLCFLLMAWLLKETVPQRMAFPWAVANPIGSLYLLTTSKTALLLSAMCFLALTGSSGACWPRRTRAFVRVYTTPCILASTHRHLHGFWKTLVG
jgi:MFS family permease